MSQTPAPLNIKALAALYHMKPRTFSNRLDEIEDLGEYRHRQFTPRQLQKIVDEFGPFNGFEKYLVKATL
jgi:hypothetical protein